MNLVVVDTGYANLASVKYAFERLGVSPLMSDQAELIQAADKVILPGVGAAPYAMERLNAKGLTPVLKTLRQPVLGICLGMQLLYAQLEEGGEVISGLGFIDGAVKELDTADLPSPHMGWNKIGEVTDDPLVKGLSAGDYAYFVHSFAAPVSKATLASATYGASFSAIVRGGEHKNIWGCQFHPERSSKTGAIILKNFLDISL